MITERRADFPGDEVRDRKLRLYAYDGADVDQFRNCTFARIRGVFNLDGHTEELPRG